MNTKRLIDVDVELCEYGGCDANATEICDTCGATLCDEHMITGDTVAVDGVNIPYTYCRKFTCIRNIPYITCA